MYNKKFIFIIGLSLAVIGYGVVAQNAPNPNYTDAPPSAELAQDTLTPDAAPTPSAANPNYPNNQDYNPTLDNSSIAPEIIMDIPVEQEFVTEAPKNLPKRPSLSNGSQDEYYIDWSSEDIQSQAAIAATQHRKREIDPAKRANLTALSRVFGSLHALRVSCEGAGDQTYRARMSSMLDMEAPIADFIRDPLINAFNNGFAEGGSGQRSCPSDKEIKEANMAKLGYRLSKLMVQFYQTN